MEENNIYYNPQEQALLITSNFSVIQKRMDVGIDPKINYQKLSVSDLDKIMFKGIAFDKIDDLYFQTIKSLLSRYKYDAIAFHNSVANLSDIVLDVKHLVIGDNSKISFEANNFKNLLQITFLSLKTFKGKVLDNVFSVEKLILWYENKKSSDLLFKFPNLKEFYIYNGTSVELDLTENPLLEELQLHRCSKLESVKFSLKMQLKKAIVDGCPKVDVSNFGITVTKH